MEVVSSGLQSVLSQSQISESLKIQERDGEQRVTSKLLTSLDETSPMKLAALVDKNTDLILDVKA